MGILADRLNTMTFRVMSPDQTVRLYVTGGGMLHIEFSRGSLDIHTEASMSHELSAAFTTMMRGQAKKRRDILLAAVSEIDDVDPELPPAEPPAPLHAADAARRRFHRELQQLAATGRSPRAAVTIRRVPVDLMEVKLRKGTLQRWSGEEVVAEIQAALADLGRDYHQRVNLLRRSMLTPTGRSEEPRI